MLQLDIKFETPFSLIKSNKKRDVDITVCDSKGNNVHIEVYMPNKQSEIDGFSILIKMSFISNIRLAKSC